MIHVYIYIYIYIYYIHIYIYIYIIFYIINGHQLPFPPEKKIHIPGIWNWGILLWKGWISSFRVYPQLPSLHPWLLCRQSLLPYHTAQSRPFQKHFATWHWLLCHQGLVKWLDATWYGRVLSSQWEENIQLLKLDPWKRPFPLWSCSASMLNFGSVPRFTWWTFLGFH